MLPIQEQLNPVPGSIQHPDRDGSLLPPLAHHGQVVLPGDVPEFRGRQFPQAETGIEEDIERALAFVRTFNVSINYSGKGVTRDENICTHCGHCVTHCPTGALRIDDKTTREVIYSEADCIECLACIRVCPFGALASAF